MPAIWRRGRLGLLRIDWSANGCGWCRGCRVPGGDVTNVTRGPCRLLRLRRTDNRPVERSRVVQRIAADSRRHPGRASLRMTAHVLSRSRLCWFCPLGYVGGCDFEVFEAIDFGVGLVCGAREGDFSRF